MKLLFTGLAQVVLLGCIYAQSPTFESISILDASGIYPSDAIVDGSGNTYVIGTFSGDPDFEPGAGTTNAPDPGNFKSADSYNDAFIVKYNNDGTLGWVKAMWTRGPVTFQSTDHDPLIFFRDLALDDSDNVYMVGDIRGIADGIGDQVSGAQVANGYYPRAFVRGFSSDGSIIIQAKNTETDLAASSTGYGITVDGGGNVYITGEFTDEMNGFTVANISQSQTYFTKFNSSGTRVDQGYPIASAESTYAADQDNGGRAIAVDDSGNIFITGYFEQNADFDGGATVLDATNTSDVYVAYYNSSKVFQDVKTYTAASAGDDVKLDGSGNLFAAMGTHLVKINTSGTQVWDRDFTYSFSFSINSEDDLLVTRKSGELRFLKLLTDNTIDFQIAPPHITGLQSEAVSLHIAEYAADQYMWAMHDIVVHNFDDDVSDGYELGDGIVLASYQYMEVDNTAPTIISQSPADGATTVTTDQVFTMTFDEDVALPTSTLTGFIRIINGDGSPFINIPYTTDSESQGWLTVNEDQVSFSRSTLIEGNSYYITIDNNTFADAAGNKVTGYSGDSDWWNFTVEDNSAPTIISKSPADDATTVTTDQTFTITLDEDVALPVATLTGIIRIKNDDGSTFTNIPYYTESVNQGWLSVSGNEISFSRGTLIAGNSYYITIDDNTLADVAGNKVTGYSGDSEWWNFTVDDGLAPTITSVTEIEDGVYENYTLRFTVNFSEPVVVDNSFNMFRLGIVSPAVQYSISSNIEQTTSSSITINYEGLRHNWSYYLYIDPLAITDNSGNAFTGVTSNTEYRFLASWDEPEVIFRTPDAMAHQVIDSDIVLEFDEDVLVNGGFSEGVNAFRLIRTSDNSVIESFTKDQLQVSGSTITIDKTVDLNYESTYAITVATGLIMAASDTTRFFDGYTNTSAWRFTTDYNYWDGSQWANGTPQTGDNVTFKNDYAFTADEVLEVNAVYVPAGVTLSIENNATLKHESNLESDGDIIIESGSSINSQGSFTGNGGSSLTVKRNTTGGIGDGMYSFVGAPFYNYDFTTVTGNFKHSYNQGSNAYVDASGVTNMIAGRGYTLANNDYIEFVGVSPITGDVSIGIQNSGESYGYNLVSNPYTAAVSYDALMAAEGPSGSGDITSTVYIWDDGGSGVKSQSDFITVNTLGSVTGGSGRSSDFNGHIGVAQGFFVESTQANTSLTVYGCHESGWKQCRRKLFPNEQRIL